MDTQHVIIFLLSISVMLFSAKLLGELCTRIKLPAIVGEILAGILLGSTVFGMVAPDLFNWLFPEKSSIGIALNGITTIAVVLLLLVSGLEVDLAVVIRERKTAAATSLIGIIIPFTLGFGISYLLPDIMGNQDESMHIIFPLFIGTAIAISSLPVIAKILMDLKIFKTDIGLIIIAAAMLNDLIGWMIFSVILGLIGGTSHSLGFGYTILYTFIFVIGILLFGRKLINWAIPIIQKKFSFPGAILNFILILGFIAAAFTEYIGVHAILGAFIMGIAIGDSAHLKEETREIIHQFVTNIFAPLFFVSIGLRVNFITNFNFAIVAILLILAFTGKVFGSALGARLSGVGKNESLAIGFGMSSSGAMGIIIGLIALNVGLINEEVFVGLVIMALFTSIASAPMMSYFLKRKEGFKLNDLLSPSGFIFSNASSKDAVINELVDIAAAKIKIPAEEILQIVYAREAQGPTGIANYLAIPHAKLKISKPYLFTAKVNVGINFGAFDELESRIIFLLLTPESNNEIQLQLLAETAKKFGDREKVEELLSLDDKNIFIEKLKLI
ncbi:MAG: cation:proton antiporter [Ignavibacteriaceae bacterium]|nr:cation:proton antiporter [Ignavibacteriaceae bacterium]